MTVNETDAFGEMATEPIPACLYLIKIIGE